MEIEEFALATWLNEYETDVEFNLAASTGPLWTAEQLLELEEDGETGWAELGRVPLNYVHAAGTRELRRAVADSYGGGIDPEWVQVTTGAGEALWLILFDVCVRGANVIVPHPCYPAMDGIPRALGAEVRYWRLRPENEFRLDLGELPQLIDRETRAIVVCSPHKPHRSGDGAGASPRGRRAGGGPRYPLHQRRGVSRHLLRWTRACQCRPDPQRSGDCDVSKALSLAGLRIGWILERDDFRRQAYYNARSFITISSSVLSERLAALALRRYRTIWERNTNLAAQNLRALAALVGDLTGRSAGWSRRAALPASPGLKHQADSEPLCRRLVKEAGVLVAPGYTFSMPAHFRLGFGVAGALFPEALGRVRAVLQSGVGH